MQALYSGMAYYSLLLLLLLQEPGLKTLAPDRFMHPYIGSFVFNIPSTGLCRLTDKECGEIQTFGVRRDNMNHCMTSDKALFQSSLLSAFRNGIYHTFKLLSILGTGDGLVLSMSFSKCR